MESLCLLLLNQEMKRVLSDRQDMQDIQLEDERDKLLTKRAILIQKVVRGFLIRQRYTKMKTGSILIQKTWRGFRERQRYIRVSNE